MLKSILTIFIITLFFNSVNVNAKVRGESIIDGLSSKVLGEHRELLVHLPNNYHQNISLNYPVLYLLDGQRNFDHAIGSLDLLNQSYMADEMIIIGIKNTHRTRDFTPTYDESYNRWGVSGGADNFLDFIEKELIPYVNENYRTNNFKILSGHSLGGLLAIYSLQSRSHLFQAHFAFSPSLWWHEEVIFKGAEELLTNGAEINNALYLNIANEGGDMRNSFDRYIELLKNKNIKGLLYKSELEEQENHGTSALVGQTKAYRFINSVYNCPKEISAQGIPAINQFYTRLSKEYGYQIKPSYRTVMSAAYDALSNKEYAKAIGLFEFNIKNNPYIPDGYDRLAYALEENGKLVDALKMTNKAVKMSLVQNAEYNSYLNHKAHLLTLIP
jgi:predicted alpha/beta superfamily hydrolase